MSGCMSEKLSVDVKDVVISHFMRQLFNCSARKDNSILFSSREKDM